ncbi:hypothetical protein EVAR_81876_1 [Eumeta japonica]|uniref:Uncharacterized protein n=1 Tax=Eumeta variegata TaxID=151549 RepID=A0A4C1UX06_EUMVA|nr:hypothetical protein EVAR_81876_1 [Eumeta japonica]
MPPRRAARLTRCKTDVLSGRANGARAGAADTFSTVRAGANAWPAARRDALQYLRAECTRKRNTCNVSRNATRNVTMWTDSRRGRGQPMRQRTGARTSISCRFSLR